MPTVAAVIIGDEILTGKFADENGPHLIGRLRSLGADLVRLAVIGDGVADIGEEVARSLGRADWVITTGGVGPTHDDRTFEGIGAALGVPLEVHPGLAELLDRYGLPRSGPALRMATVPRGAELVGGDAGAFPVVRCDRVLIFPGVPALFRSKLEQVADLLRGEAVHTARLATSLRETEIAERLGAIAEAEPDVAIGSYPRFGERPRRVVLTLESRDRAALDRARGAVQAMLEALDGVFVAPSPIVDGVGAGEPSE